MNLTTLFESTCSRRATATALVWGDQTWTWGQLDKIARNMARSLVAAGVKPGDRVAVFLPNSPATVFSHLAIMLAGAIRVPVNSAYTAREAEHPIRATACKIVLTDDARRPLVPADVPARLDTPPDESADLPAVRDDDVSLICFTSGTSGKPKGVPLTHGNLAHNIQGLVEFWEWTERDTLLLSLPLMHLHGLGNGLNGWIATGCTVILQEKFDPETVLATLPRATMFFAVPAMYARIMERPVRPLKNMRIWVSGSAPLDAGLEERFAKAYGPIVNRYGMTETCMITANPARAPRRGSVGKPLPGMEVKIIDQATGKDRPDGESGEIVVRGPSVAKNYWGGEIDAATRHEGGFFRTGDLGHRDRDGYFFITGRAKDIIISGGTNIAPLEIEEVLAKHDGVREALALGVPDPVLGEVVRAVVVAKNELSPAEISSWCEKHLAKFKRPRDVRIVRDPLPRNAMQKLDRKRARELYG